MNGFSDHGQGVAQGRSHEAMTNELWVCVVLLAAALTQSVSGFGFALVAMSLLPGLIGIKLAVPLVALMSILSNALMVVLHRQHLNLSIIWRLAVAALLAMPIGVVGLHYLPDVVAQRSLGILIVGYAGYEILNLKTPHLNSPRWAYLFGALSGVFSGAYSVGGPPVIFYGNCQRWAADDFRSNLPTFFLASSTATLLGHLAQGHLTIKIWVLALLSLPTFAAGLAIGIAVTPWIHPKQFRQIVIALLLLSGTRLMLQ